MTRATTLISALLIALMAPASASAQEPISVDEVIDLAISGVGSRYIWGGGCWDPEDRSRLGADCSGYVAKCWQLPEPSPVTSCGHPYSTWNFYHERTSWDAVDRSSAERGDAFVYRSDGAGHIVLFDSGDPWGNAEVYEARGTAYGIVHRVRNISSSYRVRRRHELTEDRGPTPQLSLAAELEALPGEALDFCTLMDSDGVADTRVGQRSVARLYVANEGEAPAFEVTVGLELNGTALVARHWQVFDDWSGHDCGEPWCDNDANDIPTNPPHDDPGSTITLQLSALSPGETKMILLELEAVAATFPAAAPAGVRLYVQAIDELYERPSWEAEPTESGVEQEWNDGDLRLELAQDVVGAETCNGEDDDCDGEADEALEGCGEPVEDPPWDSWIGGPCRDDGDCLSGLCLTERAVGYPGGMCTEPCDRYCPDREGEPVTFCVTLGEEGRCFSRQDHGVYPDGGCRAGYEPLEVSRHEQSWIRRDVCLPSGFDGAGGVGVIAGSGDVVFGEDAAPLTGLRGAGCSATASRPQAPVLAGLLLLALALLGRRRRYRGSRLD